MDFDKLKNLTSSKKILAKKNLESTILKNESLERKEIVLLHKDLSKNYGLNGDGLMYQDSGESSLNYIKRKDGSNQELMVSINQIAIDKYYISISGDMGNKFSEGYISKDKVGQTVLQYFRELVGHE